MSETEIKVPNIGDFKDVEVIEVLVSEGQTLKKNDPLITIESDKSSVEIPSNLEGKIKTVKLKVGDKVSEGDLILTLENKSTIQEKVKKKPVIEKEFMKIQVIKPEINELIKQFSKLPGLGPKSAKRIILKLINNKDSMVKPLAKSLAEVYKKVVRCPNCGNLKILDKICICTKDNSYDKICVVENLADMWAIESSNIFKGYFHILGGTLNNNDNNGQKNLLIDSLLKRIEKNKLKEVIIATSATVEGQTTAHYIEDELKNSEIKISKLGQGLPVGGEIEQLDDGTLVSAFKNRVPVSSE